MTTPSLSNIVLSAEIAPYSIWFDVKYQEACNPIGVLTTRINGEDFSRYIHSMHGVDFPGLEEWYLRNDPSMVNIRIAQYMEHCLSLQEQYRIERYIPMSYEDHYDQRNWSSYGERTESSRQ